MTSVKLYFKASWLPLCVFYPCVCLQCGHCVHHKGILSPPSWSYQSLAELRGVGKVIHTTGGSIHTADSPRRCLLCLFDSSQASKDGVDHFSFFSVCFVRVHSQAKRLGRGQRSTSQSRGCSDISSSLFQSLSKKQRRRVSETDRGEGLHRMSSTSSLSPWLLMPSCRAGSLCFITVRRLS